ncbi:phage major capsid protein [Streptomyces sp. NPDC058424]|uniref:phage major capsid protein n=1 Tax=Streptomyces sp. NPDC058424 TaxID=3346491 RepID=UPI0036528D9B
MKTELRSIFDNAEKETRGLRPEEIAFVLNNTERGTEARAEAMAMINGGRASTPEGRAALRKVLEADAENAAEYAEHRARTEAWEAESRALVERMGGAADILKGGKHALDADESNWRSILPSAEEFRTLIAGGTPSAGGHAVPAKVADRAVEFLRAASVFMGVPGINIHRFEGGSFILPTLNSTTMPGVVAEGAKITEAAPVFGALSFTPIKYADLYKASNEILADAAVSMRDLIFKTMLQNIATQVDKDCFQGAGGATALTGLTKAGMGTAVNLSTGNTQVSWDHVIDAYSDIEAAGATPAVIWSSPDQAKGLRKARENGTNGGYLAGQVTDPVAQRGLGLPIYVSANLPAKTVIVAAPDRIHVGLRSDVRIAVSEDYGFDADFTGFRGSSNLVGVRLPSTPPSGCTA